MSGYRLCTRRRRIACRSPAMSPVRGARRRCSPSRVRSYAAAPLLARNWSSSPRTSRESIASRHRPEPVWLRSSTHLPRRVAPGIVLRQPLASCRTFGICRPCLKLARRRCGRRRSLLLSCSPRTASVATSLSAVVYGDSAHTVESASRPAGALPCHCCLRGSRQRRICVRGPHLEPLWGEVAARTLEPRESSVHSMPSATAGAAERYRVEPP
jgi:hypothetical protein